LKISYKLEFFIQWGNQINEVKTEAPIVLYTTDDLVLILWYFDLLSVTSPYASPAPPV